MSAVDYKQFYVKFSSNGNKKSVRNEKKQKKEVAPESISKPKRKGRGSLFSVVMILLCFAFTFLLAGVLNKDTILSVFSKEQDYFAYVLVSKVPETGDTGLNELSKFVRAGGGGGNILQKDGNYYVVHAVYMNKKDAQTVQSRDKTSEIFGLKEKPMTTAVDNLKQYVQEYNEKKCALIQMLYDATVENAKTEDNDVSVKAILKMKEPFQALKEKILIDKKVVPSETLPIIVAIDTLLGRLEGLTTASASRISLISDMRYQLYAICTD